MKHDPNKKLHPDLEKESLEVIFQEIKKINSPRDLTAFLAKNFTDSEMDLIIRRAAVRILLRNNNSYRKIRDLLEISQGTVSRVKDQIGGRGYGRNPNRKRVYSAFTKKRRQKKTRRIFPKYKGVESII